MPPGAFLLLSHRGSVSSSIFFFSRMQKKKSLYSHNKNKSVLYFTIYFKYFHYEALMSPPRSRRRQHLPKTPAARDAFRRRTWYSHTSPPSRPRPRTRTHQCIRKSISVACSSEVRSTALPHTHLCIPTGTPSWSSGKRHSPAAFGNNLLSAPLDKRFLEKNKKHKHFQGRRCESPANGPWIHNSGQEVLPLSAVGNRDCHGPAYVPYNGLVVPLAVP